MLDHNAVQPCCHHEWWRPALGFESWYQVSSCGRIYSARRANLLNPYWNETYFSVCLHQDGQQRNKRVHALVTEAFYGPRPSDLQVCHNDGNPCNNHLANLRYGSPSDNGRDRSHHQTRCRRGHELSGVNIRTYMDRHGNVRRYCLACQKINSEKFRARHGR